MATRRVRVAALAGVVTLCAPVLLGCSGSGGAGADGPPEMKMAISTAPQGWDPYKCVGATRNVLGSLYDTLMRVQPDGSVKPSLATDWKYESPTRFTMTLRDGVKFADGTPVDANVVKANLERSVKTPTGVTSQFASDKPTITAPSSTEVAIDLGRPDPDLPYQFSYCGGMIVHPDLVAHPERLANETNGTGPYALDAGATIPNASYAMNKKDGYWDDKAFPFTKLTFTVIADANANLNALVSGQADLVPGSFQGIQQAKSAGMESVDGNVSPFVILLNDRSGELAKPLGDVRVRQALNYAIDRKAIMTTLFGEKGLPTPGIIAKGAPGYDPAVEQQYPYDPAKAKALLAEAGYPDGFPLTVLAAPVNQFDTLLAAVSDYWKQIGVNVTQDVKDPNTYLGQVITKNYAAEVYPLKGTPPYSVMNRFFGPTAGYNPFKTTDPELSAALDKAATGDEAGLREAQARLLSQAWYVGVGFDSQYYFYNPKKLGGLKMINSDNTPLFYDWTTGTK